MHTPDNPTPPPQRQDKDNRQPHHTHWTTGGCSKAELAAEYCPQATPQAARRTLNRWIKLHPNLLAKLTATGYQTRQHRLTPLQVSIIAEALGEPC